MEEETEAPTKAKNRQLKEELEKYKQDCKILRAALASRDRDAAQAKNCLQKVEEDMKTMQILINKQQAEITVLANEKTVLDEQNHKLSEKVAAQERDLRQAKGCTTNGGKEKQALEKQLDAQRKQIADLQLMHKAARDEWVLEMEQQKCMMAEEMKAEIARAKQSQIAQSVLGGGSSAATIFGGGTGASVVRPRGGSDAAGKVAQEETRKLSEENAQLTSRISSQTNKIEALQLQVENLTEELTTTRAKLADLLRLTEGSEKMTLGVKARLRESQQQCEAHVKRITELEREVLVLKVGGQLATNTSPTAAHGKKHRHDHDGGSTTSESSASQSQIDIDVILASEDKKRAILQAQLDQVASDRDAVRQDLHQNQTSYENEIQRIQELVHSRTNALCATKEELARVQTQMELMQQQQRDQAAHTAELLKQEHKVGDEMKEKLMAQIKALQRELDFCKQTTSSPTTNGSGPGSPQQQHGRQKSDMGLTTDMTTTRTDTDPKMDLPAGYHMLHEDLRDTRQNLCSSTIEVHSLQTSLQDHKRQVYDLRQKLEALQEKKDEEKQKSTMHCKLLQSEILELTRELERINNLYIASVRQVDDVKTELKESKNVRNWQMGMIQQVVDQAYRRVKSPKQAV
eukprot:TRINITY_DN53098_c0_g1_i1.p1 TRINITY_DN53098_c0_g1~~TRINITY_DN53098_c0_g1_i1.p1  ORF type:complete len:632 (+),score=80.28 TRINITY_DN53098_c0_g1_i1:30-1925(+)